MKKLSTIKNSPWKILLIYLFTGFISAIGIVHLSSELDVISQAHNQIMAEHVKNIEYISEIKSLLYEHQSIIANHLLSNDSTMYGVYEKDESRIMEKLKKLVVDFSFRMKGGVREQLYHNVYSDYAGYLKNVATIIQFSNKDEKEMAVYYNDNVLKPFLSDINQKFELIEKQINSDIEEIESVMENRFEVSKKLRLIVSIIEGLLLLGCTIFCAGIAFKLDNYKVNLEKELSEKNKVIQQNNEKTLRLQNGIIYGLANLIESRDGSSGEHVKRTSIYVEMIAKAAQKQGLYGAILNDNYIETLKKVAPLHDIGKILVSDLILKKRGALTKDEMDEIKVHVEQGERVIKEVFQFMEDDVYYVKMACEVATYHHEWWNGEGYCKGLAGDMIPLSARIMAIADVFDALISERCYKKAYSIDESFKIIQENSGSHFDPTLVNIFMSLRQQIELLNQ